MTVTPAIELKGISKAFGPVQANKDISIRVMPGTIHGIIGENGAGKSTLMSILYGFYKADAGEIWINGKKTDIPDSQAAIRAGIGMVFQHFKLVENFTVLENIILGVEEGRLLRPSLTRARAELDRLAREYELNVDPDALIEDIGVGQQQRVEILKALYRKADILILDEPTGVLTPAEAHQLFRILERLKAEGKTVILITHKLREIMEITDTVSVMRRGQMTATVKTAETSPPELAELMVGRKVLLEVDKAPATPGRVVLEVQDLRVTDDKGVERLKGISFQIRAGEILGLAGVAGNGQSELLRVLGGYGHATGSVKVNGEEIDLTGRHSDGQTRRRRGIAHVPEDRQHEGLIMDFAAWENIAFGYHHDPKYQKSWLFMDNAAIRADAAAKMERFDVRPPNPDLPAKSFSGGNQQKLVVAREIEQSPDLLLVGQPTRGVDIGAIEFIHKQIIALRDQGKAILLVSVELDEIMSLSDRIAVIFDGRIMGDRLPEQTDAQDLGLLMAGVTGKAA
jgi:simple sugar transport system ATP-binding protein